MEEWGGRVFQALKYIYLEDVSIFRSSHHAAKAGPLDHILPVRLQLAYITKQQAFNSGFCGQFDPAKYGQCHQLFQVSVTQIATLTID